MATETKPENRPLVLTTNEWMMLRIAMTAYLKVIERQIASERDDKVRAYRRELLEEMVALKARLS